MIDSAKQLLQLAHLMQIGGEVLRQIATLRQEDQAALMRLAETIATAAAEIERVAERGRRH